MSLFYIKDKRRNIVPVDDFELDKKAKEILEDIRKNHFDNIPKYYKDNWDKVKLYSPSWDIEKANAILINPEEWAYDLWNKLNDLTWKERTKFTCSWFIFNALASDLKEEKEISADSELHPATFSPTMISDFIKFFTKEWERVLDPFAWIWSTLVGCKRTWRIGYWTELNQTYFNVMLKRVPEFKDNIYNVDCREIKKLNLPEIDFSISSPPYRDVLNRSTDHFKQEREKKWFDSNYWESDLDLWNIDDYDRFVEELCSIYRDIYTVLRKGAYIVIIVKNVKKWWRLYPLAWDIARELWKLYVLKDEKLWIQDKIWLSPYWYPSAWASNILHHYCIILRKE